MEFTKLIEDIVDTYKEVYVTNPADALSKSDMNNINTVLFSYLNSYYFKELYNNLLILKDNDDYIYIAGLENSREEDQKITLLNGYDKVTLDNFRKHENIYYKDKINFELVSLNSLKKLGIHQFYTKKNKLFNLDYIPKYQDPKEFNVLTNEKITKIIEELKNKNDFYNIVFESNKIRQNINLKQKFDFKYTKIDFDTSKNSINSVFSKLADIHKVSGSSPSDVRVSLINNYDLRYLIELKGLKSMYIAHNNYEVAAIITASVSFSVNSMNLDNADNFEFISSVSTAKSFRGHQLGTKLFEKVISSTLDNNKILIRSRPSDLGNLYLKNNIDNLINKNKDLVVIEDNEKDIYAYQLINLLFTNKENIINWDVPYKQKNYNFNESKDLLIFHLHKLREINSSDLGSFYKTTEIENYINTVYESSITKNKPINKIP